MDNTGAERLAGMIEQADAVLIAASNGFDIADGYNQFACDDEFRRVFGDLYSACGLTSILQGLMARWPSIEDRWRFLTKLVDYGYGSYEPSDVMWALAAATRDMPRFVVTCNCNSRFLRAGLSADAVFETEGSYARLCCTAGCTRQAFDALEMLDAAQDMPPRCPNCGAPLDVAVDDRGRIVELEPFASQQARYRTFLKEHAGTRTLVLELGVGQGNRAIKAPLMAWAERAPRATYAVVNRDAPVLPALPDERVLGIQDDLGPVLLALAMLRKDA